MGTGIYSAFSHAATTRQRTGARYRVYRREINEKAKRLKLWIRRKRGHRKLICSGCGRKLEDAHDVREREVRDLPCMEFRTTVVIEVYRVCCPDCGITIEKASVGRISHRETAVLGPTLTPRDAFSAFWT